MCIRRREKRRSRRGCQTTQGKGTHGRLFPERFEGNFYEIETCLYQAVQDFHQNFTSTILQGLENTGIYVVNSIRGNLPIK